MIRKLKTTACFFENHEGETLAGSLHLPKAPDTSGVIWGHCFTCSRHTAVLRDISRRLAENGIASLRFDFSGNGQSEGDFANTTYSRHVSEMISAVDFMTERGFTRLGLGGHSMGASISLLAASRLVSMGETAVKAVCALGGRLTGGSPAQLFTPEQLDHLKRFGKLSFISRGRSLVLHRAFVDDLKHHNLPHTLTDFRLPLMIIHGDADEIIPVGAAFEAGRLNPRAEIVVIHGADHMFLGKKEREEITEKTAEWFGEIFAG